MKRFQAAAAITQIQYYYNNGSFHELHMGEFVWEGERGKRRGGASIVLDVTEAGLNRRHKTAKWAEWFFSFCWNTTAAVTTTATE